MRSRAVLAGPTTLLAAASARATGAEGLAHSYNYCGINTIGTQSPTPTIATVTAIPTFLRSLLSSNSRRITLHSTMNGENHPIGHDGRNETIDQQEEEEEEEEETESDRFGNLRVWNHSELVDYYEQMKQILLDELPDNDRNNENQNQNQNQTSNTAAFPLRILEPRHRKSMVLCVLNHPTATKTATKKKTGTTATKRISRAELKERLRLVEQRRRWNLTRKLLFGDDPDWNRDGNANGNGNGNGEGASSRPAAHRYWWDNEAIARETAPGFLRRLHDYRSELRAASSPSLSPLSPLSPLSSRNRSTTMRTIRIPTEEEGKNPKKFLSRLASGRRYKGDFGVLLKDYCPADATNSANGNGSDGSSRKSAVAGVRGVSLSLYEEIIKDKPSSSEDPSHELELLRCFIDELEEESTGLDADGDGDDDSDGNTKRDERITVDREQLVLLRAICDLDFDLSSSSRSSLSPSPSPFKLAAMGDGGRALGKRGERHLASYLSEKRSAIDVASASVDASALLRGNENENDGENENENDSGRGRRPPWLLSPVWVRPRSKNRRNLKERCRCVLEIPTFSTGNYASSGTTSEYDAMIAVPVDHPNQRNTTTNNANLNNATVLAIAEVWEAKATLDPSSLLDVLEKKVLSLQSLLLDEESRVVQLSGVTTEANIGGNPNSNHANTTTAAAATSTTTTTTTVGNEGANLVLLLPRSVDAEEEDPSTPTNGSPGSSLSPRVFRVGLECPERTEASALGNNDDFNIHDDEKPTDPLLHPFPPLPKIGIFASRMLGPRTGARRIKTVVGERLLETDLETVKSVLGVPGNDARDDSDDYSDSDSDARRSSPGARTAGLVRDESVAMVERILRLVRAFRPEVVVGMLGE